MTIQAIETHYAGHRFRSRLEARWAVFFDVAGIAWQYEPQGYMINVAGEKRPYLPDFWLPELDGGTWCEVKGSLDGLDIPLLAYAAHPEHGLPSDLSGRRRRPLRQDHRLLVLGPIPDGGNPVGVPLHCCLTWDATLPGAPGVYAATVLLAGKALISTSLASPLLAEDGTFFGDSEDLWETIRGGICLTRIEPYYQVARMARFEHGERPDAA